MKLVRYHGLGNDYLVLAEGPPMTAEWARQICDRHTGVGSDGVLEPVDPNDADYGVRIWNPDGSVAEKSGNGLRIFAHWLVADRGAPAHFSIDTGACRVVCDVDGVQITVDMGTASPEPSVVPVTERLVDGPIQVGGDTLTATAMGLGNPHCVVFSDDPHLDGLPWRRWGAGLEVHPRFPNRTNVQVAHVIDPSTVAIRIWERGAGETQASGSSSCGVAAAAVYTGRMPPGRIRVVCPGGDLFVTVGPELSLRLEGPVERVCTVDVDAAWVAAR